MNLEEGLLDGDVFLFHMKENEDLSVFLEDGKIVAKKNDEYLTFRDDYNGFYRKHFEDKRFIEFFEEYPSIEMFGIWDGEKFIVTDLLHVDKDEGIRTLQHFEYYHHFLVHFEIHYRMPLIKLISPSQDLLEHSLSFDSGYWMVKNYHKQKFQMIQVKK